MIQGPFQADHKHSALQCSILVLLEVVVRVYHCTDLILVSRSLDDDIIASDIGGTE